MAQLPHPAHTFLCSPPTVMVMGADCRQHELPKHPSIRETWGMTCSPQNFDFQPQLTLYLITNMVMDFSSFYLICFWPLQ